MSYIKADNEQEQEYFDFLEELRQSGDTNMYGADIYLQNAFPLDKVGARTVLSKWMKLHSDPTRILQGPTSKQKVATKMEARVKVTRRARGTA